MLIIDTAPVTPMQTAVFRMSDVDIQGWEPSSIDASAHVIPSSTLLAARQVPHLGGFTYESGGTLAQAASKPFSYSSGTTVVPQATASSCHSLARSTSMSSPTSSRSPAAAGRTTQRARTSTERKIARKLAENAAYVPRPRNSFIIFRTDFVAYRMAGDSGRPANMEPSVYQALSELTSSKAPRGRSKEEEEGTLSKQASAVWNNMSESQRRPWAERAEKEKALHAERHPDYRYKPARHGPAAPSSRKPTESRSRSGSRAPQPTRTLSLPAFLSHQPTVSLPSVPPILPFATAPTNTFPDSHSGSSANGSPPPSSPGSAYKPADSGSRFSTSHSQHLASIWQSEVGDLAMDISEASSWAPNLSAAELSLSSGVIENGPCVSGLNIQLVSSIDPILGYACDSKL